MNHNIKQLTDKFITEEDNQLFKSVIGNGIDELLKNEIDESLFFSAQKHIPSDLDEIGSHPFRSLLSEKIINNNRIKAGLLDNEYGEKFLKDGVVVIEGCDINENYNQQKYLNFLSVLEFNPSPSPNIFAERVIHKEYDEQYFIHTDIFFTSIKTFIYQHNVKIEDGPFSFVKSSHRNDKPKLKFLYEESKRLSNYKLHNVFEGWDEKVQPMGPSFRLNINNSYYSVNDTNKINEKLNELGFENETPIVGDDWTLIVADTSGLHRRFPAKPGVERVTYRHQSPRVNPFEIKYV